MAKAKLLIMERFQSQRNSLGKLGPPKISEFGPQEISVKEIVLENQDPHGDQKY